MAPYSLYPGGVAHSKGILAVMGGPDQQGGDSFCETLSVMDKSTHVVFSEPR